MAPYTQLSSGTLNIEIGGQIGGSELDQVNITGTATLGGTMNVSLINAFIPVEGHPTPFTLDPEESQTLDVDFTPS